jgi:hypothetical protein
MVLRAYVLRESFGCFTYDFELSDYSILPVGSGHKDIATNQDICFRHRHVQRSSQLAQPGR